MDQLKRRGWALPSRCYLCKADEELANHVLIHCPKAAIIWHLIFAFFWCSLGFAQFYQGNHSWLERHLCWKEKKKDVECNPYMLILDYMEGKK